MSASQVGRSGTNSFLDGLVAFNEFLSRWMLRIAFSLTILFIIISLAEIIVRATLRSSIIWSGEVATLTFVWSLFLGAAVCFRSNSHLVVDFFNAKPGGRLDQLLKLVVFIIVLTFALAFAYYGWMLAQRGFVRDTPVLGLPIVVGWAAPMFMGMATVPFAIEAYFAPGRVSPELMPPESV